MLQDSHPAGYMLRCHGYLTPENSQQTHRPAWAETRRLSRAKSLPSLCRYQTAVMATFEQPKTYLTDLSMVAREHILLEKASQSPLGLLCGRRSCYVIRFRNASSVTLYARETAGPLALMDISPRISNVSSPERRLEHVPDKACIAFL